MDNKNNIEKPKNWEEGAHTVEEMYEENDLSTCSIFVGGYINFGIYNNFNKDKEMTYEERLQSEKEVYLSTAKRLNINSENTVLDVACGLGLGTILIYEDIKPKNITGIDFPNQIERAKLRLKSIKKETEPIKFVAGSATEIPFEANYFDGITCVGGLIYFDNIKKFIQESYRVLKSNGKLSIATYLGVTENANEKMKELIHPIKEGFEFANDLSTIEKLLKENGFEAKFERIGSRVIRDSVF